MNKFLLLSNILYIFYFFGCMEMSNPIIALEEQVPSSNSVTIVGVGQPLRIMIKLTDEYSNLNKGMAIGSKYIPFTNLFSLYCRVGQPDNLFYDSATGVDLSNINGFQTVDFDIIPKKPFITNLMHLIISSGFWRYYREFTLTVTNTN